MEPTTELRPGEILAGKYRVERVLGAGGMGVVLAARHLRLDEPVAVKLMKPELATHPQIVERFIREARAALRIKGEHVVKVMDVDVLESGEPYMVMELLAGLDLAEHLERTGPLPAATAAHYLLQACEALAEAHAAGIVHRDLKPGNLFLATGAGGEVCVKVLDFGISKLAHLDGAMTGTRNLLGSPHYMSPEQMQSARNVDARSDIWSLGVILYQLLSGVVPFDGDTMPQICVSVLQATPRPLAPLRPDVPPALTAIVDRCLAKDPAQRFANVAELCAALAPFCPEGAAVSVDRATRSLGLDAEVSSRLRAAARGPTSGQPQVTAGGPYPVANASAPGVAATGGFGPNVVPAAYPGTMPSPTVPAPYAPPVGQPGTIGGATVPAETLGRRRGTVITVAAATVAVGLCAFLAALLIRPRGDGGRDEGSTGAAATTTTEATAAPPKTDAPAETTTPTATAAPDEPPADKPGRADSPPRPARSAASATPPPVTPTAAATATPSVPATAEPPPPPTRPPPPSKPKDTIGF